MLSTDNINITSSPLAPNPPSKLNIFRHNRDSLSMNSTKIGVLKQTNKVSLSGLLKRSYSGALESEIGLEILGDLTHQPLEWELSDEKLSALLVLPDLSQRHLAGADFLAALVASCFLGAFPPVDFLAVCLVRAIQGLEKEEYGK
ncbi:hypothetical protein V2J09_006214 [Rumex salicifolius]